MHVTSRTADHSFTVVCKSCTYGEVTRLALELRRGSQTVHTECATQILPCSPQQWHALQGCSVLILASSGPASSAEPQTSCWVWNIFGHRLHQFSGNIKFLKDNIFRWEWNVIQRFHKRYVQCAEVVFDLMRYCNYRYLVWILVGLSSFVKWVWYNIP